MAEKETVFVLCDNGAVMPHDLPLPTGIADRVARGQLRLVNEDGSAIQGDASTVRAPDSTPADDHGVMDLGTGTIRRPGVNAPKNEWVAWAVAQGLTVNEADGMTKAELFDLFGEKK